MDLQSKKLEFIQWFSGLRNPKIIKEVLSFKKKNEEDWWDIISDEERKEIQKGMKEADSGKTISNSSIFSKYKKWILK
ncbi:MAG: hypothetical protein GY830_06330 [Bacteroidetes bacterium]|nr:hypothetical protein [Bacteroidota bacterium]